jgi:Ras-related protein Rab-1A
MSTSTNEEEEIKFKILVLGDSSVGKTTLLLKYVDGYFPTLYVATIGVEFKTKKINVDGIDITLQIWDTAGQERFRSVTKSFLKGADGIIYVYDVTNKESFDNLKTWINTAEESITDFKKIIIGNKIDIEDKKKVSTEMLEKFCEKQNLKGLETSAKDGTNVNEMFELLTKMIIDGKTKEELLIKYNNVPLLCL